MKMNVFKGQKLAGTSLDSQGERLTLDDLQRYVEFCNGKRIPLHRQHQMGEPTTGFIENVRLVQDAEDHDEWSVIGDVSVESDAIDKGMRGFSISFMTPLIERDTANCLLYVPYPHYNEHEFISELSLDPHLNIGKWVKKSADPIQHALFGAMIAFALTPVWDHLYKSRIAPIIDRFLDAHLDRLNAKNLSLEHIQIIICAGYETELRFIPERGKEKWCFSEENITAGIRLVAEKLQTIRLADQPEIQRVVLRYEPSERAYEIKRIEYRNGEVDE